MDREGLKERIRFYTEYLKILWLIVIALAGGLSSLFSDLSNFVYIERVVLFSLGIYLLVIVGIGILKLNLDIHKLLNKLEEEKSDG